MKNGIVLEDKNKKKPTNEYAIADIIKYEEWNKSRFYRKIEQFVVPLIPSVVAVGQAAVALLP